MKSCAYLILGLFAIPVFGQPVGDCTGTPVEAVIELPAPLNDWGRLACTEYGHIITNLDGWIWSNPGGYNPVMIPSQMVRNNPEAIGNASYFIKIEMSLVAGEELDAAVALFEEGFDASETKPSVYNLEVVSVSGRKLGFKFFDYGASKWGVWCNVECDPDSRFMLLNMNR